MKPTFWTHVEKTDTCWLWTGKLTNGYGRFARTGAHRVSYMAVKGPIPPGLELDHLCRVRNWVNPDHLEAVDKRTNCLRGISPPAQNAKKATCPEGHQFDSRNSKGRLCLECRRRYANEMWQRRGDEIKAARAAKPHVPRLRKGPPPVKRICKGTATRHGEHPCPILAMRDSDYCWYHRNARLDAADVPAVKEERCSCGRVKGHPTRHDLPGPAASTTRGETGK